MSFNPFTLFGKIVLVTGASSGIGREIAVVCSKMGATIVATARNKAKLEETKALLEGHGHIIVTADLTNTNDINNLVDHLPELDGVVHCAGVNNRVLCRNVSVEDFEKIINPNLKAPILLQAGLLECKKINRGASIVFIASKAADMPSVGNAIYSASKGALISYAKCLGLELAPRLIRANCICPAMVWTDLIIRDGLDKDYFEKAQLEYPLKRYGRPEDIAYLATYLLSDASMWMTGSCVDISGGAMVL